MKKIETEDEPLCGGAGRVVPEMLEGGWSVSPARTPCPPSPAAVEEQTWKSGTTNEQQQAATPLDRVRPA